MKIKKFITDDSYQTNSYIVSCEKTGKAMIIDLGQKCKKLLQIVRDRQIKVEYILNTHAHHDHCAGDRAAYKELKAPLLIGLKEKTLFKGITSLKLIPDFPIEPRYVVENDTFPLGALSFSIIETPGHTDGSISVFIENAVFTGDLFEAGTNREGKTVLNISNSWSEETIAQKILTIRDCLSVVYPGHGPSISISELINGAKK